MRKRICVFTALVLGLPAAVALSLSAFWRREAKEGEGGWTGPFKPGEYRTFVALVRDYLRSRRREIEVRDGYVVEVGGENDSRYGLENLAQVCSGHRTAEWPEIIARHFDMLLRAEAERRAGERERTFEEAKSLLALRLWPAEYLAQVGTEHVICREDLPGTVTVLVFDLPETVQQVQPEEAERWGRSTEELFALALDNQRRKPRPQIQRAALPDSTKVTVFSGNSFFVASEALRLEQFPGCTGRGGALVGVPTRHVLIAYPVEDMGVLRAMPLLVPIIVGMFAKGPGSVSPRLYWYHDKRFTDLPYTIDSKRVRMAPPQDFVEMLKGFAGGE